jgi:hypothetical protein
MQAAIEDMQMHEEEQQEIDDDALIEGVKMS